jgi:hypothetical protein
MDWDWRNELTARGTRRKRRPKGHDPLVTCRTPEPVLALVKAEAAERNIPVSAVIRDALAARYSEDGARAA